VTVLQIYLRCMEGKEAELETRFRDTFHPAISLQKGFLGAQLIRAVDDPLRYHIEFTFESEELRQGWVASDDHQHAVPVLKALCSDWSFARFDVVERT
jgi:heme-degrading monooxygenase HmoA